MKALKTVAGIAAAAMLASCATQMQPMGDGGVATPLPMTSPESAGFSSEGLARMDRFWEREIAAKRSPGAIVAIARDGKLLYYKKFGVLDPATNEPMRFDAMFTIASMTKPMVTVGALAMMEDGRLPMRSRLDEYFPAFANAKVGKVVGSEVTTQPARQPIYINDLLRHTSGIPYGGRADTPLHKMWPTSSAGSATSMTAEEFMARIAALPLTNEPGTVWNYGLSYEVAGLVMEKVAGKRLEAVLKESIWDKVGMPDTYFQVPEAKRARIAKAFPNDPLTGRPQTLQLVARTAKFDCGGGCAFSTVPDYVRFGQMLLDGGSFEGRRVIGPKSVIMMTSDQLGPDIRNEVVGIEGYKEGYGFGLGVVVRTQEGVAAIPGSIGDYSWNGANGTIWWNDPQERLVVVVGSAAPGEIRKRHREQVVDLVYGAMTEVRAGRNPARR